MKDNLVQTFLKKYRPYKNIWLDMYCTKKKIGFNIDLINVDFGCELFEKGEPFAKRRIDCMTCVHFDRWSDSCPFCQYEYDKDTDCEANAFAGVLEK